MPLAVTADAAILEQLALDAKMQPLIETFGPYAWRLSPLFPALVRAVTAQLISSAAARATYARLREATDIDPERILTCAPDDLRALGIPYRKAEYILALAALEQSGGLRGLEALPDEAVIAELTALRGIGVWTAEMALIFSLGRMDVWPLADIGVVRALERYYALETKGEMTALGERFRPHRSAAVWYLWRWIESNRTRGKPKRQA